MKAQIRRPSHVLEGSHEIYLSPESDADIAVLNQLLREYKVVGCGVDAATSKPLHARILLTPLAKCGDESPFKYCYFCGLQNCNCYEHMVEDATALGT